jgi:hypothetical protein
MLEMLATLAAQGMQAAMETQAMLEMLAVLATLEAL